MSFYDRALVPQEIDVPLFAGQNSSADPKLVEVLNGSSTLLAENGRYYSNGQLQKRFGNIQAGNKQISGQAIPQGRQVMSSNNALFEHDGNELYNYNTPNKNWLPLGALNAASVDSASLTQTLNNVDEMASAAIDGAVLLAWTENGQVFISIYNPVSGTYIQSRNLLAANAVNPNVFAVNGDFYIFYRNTDFNNLSLTRIVGSNLSQIGQTITIPLTMSTVQPRYAACIGNFLVAAGTQLYVATDVSDGSTTASVCIVNLPVVSLGISFGVQSPFTVSLGAYVAGTQLWMEFAGTPSAGEYVWIGNSSGVAFIAGNTPSAVTSWPITDTVNRATFALANFNGGAKTPTGTLFTEVAGTYNGNTQIFIRCLAITLDGSGNPAISDTGNAWFTNQNCYLASRGFTADSFGYAWVLSDFKFQTQLELIDTQARPVARALTNGAAAPNDNTFVSLPWISQTDSTSYYFAARRRAQLAFSTTGAVETTIGGALLNLDYSEPQTQAVYLNGRTYFSGAAPKLYDGAELSEVGFWFYPDTPVATLNTSGGALSAGLYTYAVVYSWYDNGGQQWFSAALLSPPGSEQASGGTAASITATLNSSVTLSNITYLQGSNKQNVTISIYRTLVNGFEFFLVGTIPNIDQLGYLFTSFTDGTADADLNGAVLYTDGSVPPYLAPPGISYLFATPNQLFGLVPETQEVWVSNIAGSLIPPQYVEGQTIELPLLQQPPAGVIVMDGNLYITGADDWLVTNASGQLLSSTANIQFAPPVKLPFDSGCVSKGSLQLSEAGIYYQSKKGIQLLSRQQQTVFIGEGVKNYTDNVLASTVVPEQQQVRFLQQDQVLVWDYVWQRWSIYTYSQMPLGMCTWLEQAVMVQDNGVVQVETAGNYRDNGRFVQRNILLPWVKPAGLNGYARCWEFMILGEANGNTSLAVQIAYQFDPTLIDRLVINGSAVNQSGIYGSGLGTYGQTAVGRFGSPIPARAYQFRGIMPRQKAGAFQFMISDIDSGEAADVVPVALNVLSLTVGLYAGMARLPAGKQVG